MYRCIQMHKIFHQSSFVTLYASIHYTLCSSMLENKHIVY